MDIATIVGLFLGIGLIGGSMFLAAFSYDLSMSNFWNLESMMIVLGGTLSATAIAFRLNEVKRVLKKGGSFFSTMISEADYDIDTTYITEKGARKLLSDFKIISFDKQSRTYDNQKIKHSLLIIHVQKI